jgi:hypothetical protein
MQDGREAPALDHGTHLIEIGHFAVDHPCARQGDGAYITRHNIYVHGLQFGDDGSAQKSAGPSHQNPPEFALTGLSAMPSCCRRFSH